MEREFSLVGPPFQHSFITCCPIFRDIWSRYFVDLNKSSLFFVRINYIFRLLFICQVVASHLKNDNRMHVVSKPLFQDTRSERPPCILIPDFVVKLLHSKLRSITHVATKVHMILRSFVVLTWMRDTIELV